MVAVGVDTICTDARGTKDAWPVEEKPSFVLTPPSVGGSVTGPTDIEAEAPDEITRFCGQDTVSVTRFGTNTGISPVRSHALQ